MRKSFGEHDASVGVDASEQGDSVLSHRPVSQACFALDPLPGFTFPGMWKSLICTDSYRVKD